ncbi:MAG TPA: DUF4148 domain-containing protein [Pseudorhodoferax sp.]|jgi:hypothetical protein|nr:DUF4148 domain-containing protein [Pseudorhodoferax sp.]
MSRTPLLLLPLAALLVLGQPALANQAEPLTREQVRAEVLQARTQGQLFTGGEAGAWPAPPASGTPATRAQVQQALAASGPLPSGEGVAPVPPAATGTSTLSRAAVHAQAVAALRAGLLPGGEV